MQQYRALQKTNVRTFCDQRFLTIMLLSYTLHWKAIIMETFLSTPPDLMSPGLERHHYHVCPSWWHQPLSKQYYRTDDNSHNDDITTNNCIRLDHDNKPHRRLSLTVLLLANPTKPSTCHFAVSSSVVWSLQVYYQPSQIADYLTTPLSTTHVGQ